MTRYQLVYRDPTLRRVTFRTFDTAKEADQVAAQLRADGVTDIERKVLEV